MKFKNKSKLINVYGSITFVLNNVKIITVSNSILNIENMSRYIIYISYKILTQYAEHLVKTEALMKLFFHLVKRSR